VVEDVKEKRMGIRTHNLVFLARELGASQNIINDCAELTPDYITTRYPDAATGAPFESYTRESAERHLKMVKEEICIVKQAVEEGVVIAG
jgi:HEPN domain-containing protein